MFELIACFCSHTLHRNMQISYSMSSLHLFMLQLFAVAPIDANDTVPLYHVMEQRSKYVDSHCAAVNCSNNRQNSPHLSFFKFPIDCWVGYINLRCVLLNFPHKTTAVSEWWWSYVYCGKTIVFFLHIWKSLSFAVMEEGMGGWEVSILVHFGI